MVERSPLQPLRLLVAISVCTGWSLRNLDIMVMLIQEIYMGVPEGMDIDPKKFDPYLVGEDEKFPLKAGFSL
jgi:hypothetical protein